MGNAAVHNCLWSVPVYLYSLITMHFCCPVLGLSLAGSLLRLARLNSVTSGVWFVPIHFSQCNQHPTLWGTCLSSCWSSSLYTSAIVGYRVSNTKALVCYTCAALTFSFCNSYGRIEGSCMHFFSWKGIYIGLSIKVIYIVYIYIHNIYIYIGRISLNSWHLWIPCHFTSGKIEVLKEF